MRFGNAKGWALAATVLVIEAMGVWYAFSLDAVTPPTALMDDPAVLAPIRLPIEPTTIVPQDQPGDAGTPLRAAIDDYLADPSRYEAFIRELDRSKVTRLAGLEQVRAAARVKDSRSPFVDRANDIVVYGESRTVQAIARVGMAALIAGRVVEKDDPALARAFYEAAFSLGARAFAERLTYREMSAGVTLMGEASGWLSQLARRTSRLDDAAAIDRFADGLRIYAKDRIPPLIEAIYTLNEPKIATHAGDVFAFATRSEERVWRVEAILKLGRMRYNVGTPGRAGDQRNAIRLLETILLEETDPLFQRAATLASELTAEDFRRIR